MGISNWDVSVSSASNIQVTETTGSIQGLGAGHFKQLLHPLDTGVAATIRLNNTFARGFTKGRLRTLLRMDVAPFGDRTHFGILVMMSVATLTGTTGSCYVLGLDSSNNVWEIVKYAGGGLDSLPTVLASTTSTYPGTEANTILALQAHWAYDLTAYGGTALALYTGTATDFSDLAHRISVIDTSSPLSTSVGEGIAFSNLDASGGVAGNNGTFSIDNTRIYQWT